jgi:hypothetical protein
VPRLRRKPRLWASVARSAAQRPDLWGWRQHRQHPLRARRTQRICSRCSRSPGALRQRRRRQQSHGAPVRAVQRQLRLERIFDWEKGKLCYKNGPSRPASQVPSTFRKKTRGDLSGSQNTDSFTNGIVILSLHALKSCRRTDNFRSLEIVGGVRGGRALYSRVERRFRGHSL